MTQRITKKFSTEKKGYFRLRYRCVSSSLLSVPCVHTVTFHFKNKSRKIFRRHFKQHQKPNITWSLAYVLVFGHPWTHDLASEIVIMLVCSYWSMCKHGAGHRANACPYHGTATQEKRNALWHVDILRCNLGFAKKK